VDNRTVPFWDGERRALSIKELRPERLVLVAKKIRGLIAAPEIFQLYAQALLNIQIDVVNHE
jgi:hypothetical protein